MKKNIFSKDYQPKVSVIIPIYNTGEYLCQALDSICNQTLHELEIILINDGSTDNSQSIIEEYALKDNRIQWLTQPNQQQGVARNNGLLLARGKYIYFMDSDDLLERTTLQHCYNICERDQLNFVTFDAETLIESNNTTIPLYTYCRKNIIEEDKLWNGMELLDYQLNHNIFYVAPWLFFTSYEFLQKYFSGFPVGIIHEDHVFAMQIMLNAKRIRYIAQPFFKRRIRPDSTMTTTFSMRNIEGYTSVCTQIGNWAQQHEEWRNIIHKYLKGNLNSVIWLGHKLTFTEKMETICRFRRLRLSKYITFKKWLIFWLKKN